MESYPEIDLIIKGLKAENVRKVHLMPLMLVAGDHAINDMASDEEDSENTAGTGRNRGYRMVTGHG